MTARLHAASLRYLRSLRPRTLAAGVALALGVAALPALAQDPPARAGRIAYLSGPVSLSPGGTDAWAQAPLNRPLVAGDRLWTDAGGRDEAQFGPVIARMDAGTLMSVLAADANATQLQLSQGRIDLHVRRVDPGATIEVDTPNLAFVARAPGDYRLVVSPDGASTDVAVLRGGGDVYGDGNAYNIGAGQGYRFAGQDLQNLGDAPVQPYDDFDRWAFARDARLDRAQSARFVPADVVGYEDLDDNGAWRVVPDYGTVWVPTRVAADWAPYHSGHWAWVDPWGWTWVDDQPWGYAVSHYGRWVNVENRWAWVPAPVRERPVFAPALVAFVGAALAFGGRDDGPGVGWFPLGPHEPYRPPYRASDVYIERVNISNTVFVGGGPRGFIDHPDRIRYANRGVPGALMAMPAAQFASAAPVGRAGRPLDPRLAMRAPLTMGPGARPLPQSRIGAAWSGRLPPDAVQRRLAVARTLPPDFARPGGPAFAGGAGAGARPNFGPGPAVPVRMLRPAGAVRAGVPPPHGVGGPRFAGRPGGEPGHPGQFGQQGLAAMPAHGPGPAPIPGQTQVPGQGPGRFAQPGRTGLAAMPPHGPDGAPGRLPPASAPYPGRGQGAMDPRWAGAHGAPGTPTAPAFAGRVPQAGAQPLTAPHGGEHALGRSGMQDSRAGGPEPAQIAGRGPVPHADGQHGMASGAAPHEAHAAPQVRPMADPRARFAEAAHAAPHEAQGARPDAHPAAPAFQPRHDTPPSIQARQEAPQAHHEMPQPRHHDAPPPRPAPQPQHEAPHPQPAPQAHHDMPPPPHHDAPPQPAPQPRHDAPHPAAPPQQHHDGPPQHGGGGGGDHGHDHGH